jgi:DNA polymerase elongation subunit (family B)
VVEIDADQVLFATPHGWSLDVEERVAERARAYLPEGVRLVYPERYAALYVRGPRSRVTLSPDGRLILAGSGFLAGRLERFAEHFLRTAAPFVLAGDAVSLRRVFLDTVGKLRAHQVPLEDLCAQVTLHKSPGEYRRGNYHEEPYELLLQAGIRTWRVGQRVRYFRHRSGEARLLREGDALDALDADTEHYVQRLKSLYCHQFAAAFRKDDFERVFRLPPPGALTEDPEADPGLLEVRPMAEAIAPGTPV